jgi:hypothetical protein
VPQRCREPLRKVRLSSKIPQDKYPWLGEKLIFAYLFPISPDNCSSAYSRKDVNMVKEWD